MDSIIENYESIEEFIQQFSEAKDLSFFILMTGSEKYKDEPKEKYHFKKGIPGSKQLLNAENNGKFVYYENGNFYGKGDIGNITSQKENETTYYYAEIKNFEQFEPVDFNKIKNRLSFYQIGQAGIRKISETDYKLIIERETSNGFVSNLIEEDFELSPNELSFKPLLFDNEENLKKQIYAALLSGKNIMLLGPPGTGKTEIAQILCRIAEKKEYFYGFTLTTATSDWTTFDTIGGYVPCQDGKSLEFMPGIFLRCFKQIENNKQSNVWLIIDEISRSDIDKAFGQLFTVLSGQSVELPYLQNSRNVNIKPYKMVKKEGEITQNTYVVSNSWRLIATLNNFDKASLYQMSYAFMRRFAFIYIKAPTAEFIEANWNNYLTSWKIEIPAVLTQCCDSVKEIWKSMNDGSNRPLGPAIIKDMLDFISQYEKLESIETKKIVTDAVSSFIIPQFEGLERTSLEKLKKILSPFCEETKIQLLFKEMFE